jgi:hypothetical protein
MLHIPAIQTSNRTRTPISVLTPIPSVPGLWIAVFLATLIFSTPSFAASEQIIHDFAGHEAVFDGVGNLYGTTLHGGDTHYHQGTAFEVTP